MLNHYAERNLSRAYSYLLLAWFQQNGIAIPDGLLSVDPFSNGSGAKKDSDKLELGFRAIEIRCRKLLKGEFSHEAFLEAIAQPPSRCASEIAKALLPSEYASNRDAARKRIEEAIEAVQEGPFEFKRQVVFNLIGDDLMKTLLTGTYPLRSNLPEILDAIEGCFGATGPSPEACAFIAALRHSG